MKVCTLQEAGLFFYRMHLLTECLQVCCHVCVFVTVAFRSDIAVILFLFLFLGWPLQKSLRFCHFTSDQDEIWQECSWSKYTLIDGVRFSIWCHTVKRTAMTSFYKGKCCCLVSEHGASARHLCSSVCVLHSHIFMPQWLCQCLLHSDAWGSN